MHEIIKVSSRVIGNSEVNSVNLRDVHTFVESRQHFADWAADRLQDFGKYVDYLEHKIMTQYNQIDRIEYIVTLDTAKHICLVERNTKGKELRQYFIDCEKKLLSSPQILPTTYVEALEALLVSVKENEALQANLEQAKPDIERSKRFLSSEKDMTIEEFVKTYNRKDFGRNKMFEWLRYEGYLGVNNIALQRYINQGLFRVIQKATDYIIYTQTLITPKGFDYLVKKLDEATHFELFGTFD